MDGLGNATDPSCLQQPPVAIDIIKDLDIFGIILYSVLTLMALLSVLIYMEEAVYIYKKVPSPKKSAIMWVNGAAPVIGVTSCVGMWIPRSSMFTDFTAASYFAIVIYMFLVMMIEECGGDEAFLKRCGRDRLRISTGPCCCCCPCLPYAGISRRTLFLLKAGSFQFALLKTVFTILSIVLWANGNFDLADLSITGAAIWINPFVGILTIIALWPVSIIFKHVQGLLRSLKIIPKFAMYQMVLILSQLQSAIINILAMGGTIACAPPFSSQARGTFMNQQLLIMEMFIITLVTRMLYRRAYDPLDKTDEHEEDNKDNAKTLLQAGCGEDGVQSV
ncbi:organic solute transporter subunit alpha [Lepisosteus oculatus]|uniref:organic solute transporter subunit alpha n=1 Tax=Lepisosteus oculatus TaxID=7918 RepID=UPI0007404F8B|nr:PREDICTED: organic solute transporter subunit alpha-like [Lepisosteus oculatus]